MSIEPVTITTVTDTPLFDPEDHRAEAATQLGVEPGDLQCIAHEPATTQEIQPNLFSEDGTVLQHRVVHYTRRTTWEVRPLSKRKEPAPVIAPELEHHIPKLSRGARWHGIKDGVEGNYISTGDDLVLLDSAEGLKVLSAMHTEAIPEASRSGTGAVG